MPALHIHENLIVFSHPCLEEPFFSSIFVAFKKQLIMETIKKKQSKQSQKAAEKQPTTYQEPKRLSKIGQWMRDNPGGIYEVKDRRAVNR